VNSRIIRVDLDLEGNKLTVVQVYAPMEDTGIMEKEQFHSHLQRVADEARTDNRNVRFQVLTAASVMFRAVFWVILPCKMIVDRRFRDAYCLHHQG
jgi:hypothetical protein